MTAATQGIPTSLPPSEGEARRLLRAFVRVAFWPLLALGIFGSMAWVDARGIHDSARGVLSLGTLIGVMLLEQLVPRPGRDGIRGDPQLRQDLAFFAIQGVLEAFTYFALLAAAAWAGSRLSVVLGVSLWPSSWPWPVQVVLAFFAVDFLDYWVHRASHRIPWLWSIHVHHHDTERLHVFKGTRNHPLAGFTRVLGAYMPLLVLGVPPVLLFWYQAYIQSLGTVSHANLEFRLPSWLHRVFSTPHVHRIHHARAHDLHDRNFAAATTLWDQLFGTFEAPAPHPDPDLGVGEATVPGGGLGRRLLWPFVWWRHAREASHIA